MRKEGSIHGLVLVASALLMPAAAVAQPPPGRLLASQCAQCHGTDGNSITDLERLAGGEANDVYNELRDMKRSDDSDIMAKQAKGYSDAQLRLIAEYFASQPAPR
jgi:cytochrome c553